MDTNGKMRTCRGRILALAAAELAVCAATAATTAFYPFDEGAPGTDVASVLNAVDSTLYSGTPIVFLQLCGLFQVEWPEPQTPRKRGS